MERESDKLRRDLRRYRFLLSQITDPRAVEMLTELVKEAEARLAALDRGDGNGAAA
ncbi:MAG TPA: hypothetical protein VN668_21080 [Stellaceae bacterium]|nr:hypothetical protein [Stellaceae bacterium]